MTTDLFTPRITLPLSALPQAPVLNERHWFPMRGKSLEQSLNIWLGWKAAGRQGPNPTLPQAQGLVWCKVCATWSEHGTENCDKVCP